MSEMSSIQESLQPKLDQLECHFTWDIKKVDLVLTDVLNRLEGQVKMGLGRELGVARTHCSLGYLEFLLEHKEGALTHLLKSETLIKENPGENCDKTLIVTYGNLAWINYHMKNYSECESYLMKLQKINETFPTQSSSVPEVLGEKGWAYLKFSHKYYDRAVEVFQKAVELDPENSEWNAGYAKALYRIEPGTSCTVDSPAIKQLRLTIDDNPDDNASRILLGLKLLFCSKKLMDESEKLMVTALNGSPEDPHVIRYVGKYFRNQGSVDRSIALLMKALEISPDSGFIHHQLAMCYKTKKINLQKEKRLDRGSQTEVNNVRNKCIYYLEKATSLKANFIIAMSELALQYGEKGELSKADSLFQRTFKTAREKNDSVHVVHCFYAEFQQYSNRCEDLAIRHYEECFKMNPHSSEGGRSAKKLMIIAQRCIKFKPDDWKANEILGLIYRNFEGTKSYLATSDNEEDDEYHSNLSECLKGCTING
ncbi:interferon-induced protein with tetratricopeptide repeats 5-like [Rhinichthys klamathensis goyatoka]|uniref:interferon-induced protein with tetratricopeptide repeats 5-like n=1 Tax=Rhinichthys klamathensis goyatoka TaxID=3034132 RepID=UPI0024B575B3|nr:interferon-induced protein with tetratricopeptide repeats 5-like [Rhinichthys klamathensis goyatoka]